MYGMNVKVLTIWASATLIISVSVPIVSAARILSVTYVATPSHRRVYDPLMNELANRGHNVTVISPIKTSRPNPKIREIQGIMTSIFTNANFFEVRIAKNTTVSALDLGHIVDPICRQTYELPGIQGILLEKFDLVIASAILNECAFGLIHKLGAPYILASPLPLFSTTASFFGVPTPSSFIPSPIGNIQMKSMCIVERAQNFLAQLVIYLTFEYRIYPNAETIYREALGFDLPSVKEIGRNASLVFINSHFTLNYPRPMMPDMIEVGGMHCRPAEPLPQDLENYLNGAGESGVIYFSLGTAVLGQTMPEPIRQMFVAAFSKLKQRVLWKWESKEGMSDLPPNIKLGKWFPQQDILAHPNTRLFITQGGLLSTEEAVYHGVPLIGIPFFADQDWNMKQSESTGIALTLEITSLTEDVISETINRILNEPKFAQNSRSLSAVFKDRPVSALETAVFWTEYVIRHNGAPHLRSPARFLNIFQYHSLDVISMLVSILVVSMASFYFLLKFGIRFVLGVKPTGRLNTNASKVKRKGRKER